MDKKKKNRESRTKAQTIKGVSLSALFLLFFFFSLNFIFSYPFSNQDVQVNLNTEKGLQIYYPDITSVKQNTDFNLGIAVSNISDGKVLPNTNIDCFLSVINPKGDYVINDAFLQKSSDLHTYYVNILKSNFTELGKYAFFIHCNETNVGGAVKGTFLVTPSGNSDDNNRAFFLFVIILVYAITFISFFYGKNIPMTILGGMAMIFLGIYTINNGIIIFRDTLTNYISYLTIGIGFILSSWATLEQFNAI